MTIPFISTALHIEGRARGNKHYAKAINTTPDWNHAVALRDKAKEEKRNVLFPQVVWPTEPTTIDELDTYLTAYLAADEEEQTRTRKAAALDAVAGACERRMRAAVDDPDALLTSLATDMADVMAHVHDVVTQLHGARTPTEAIANDTVDAWKELPALRREYDSIRAAQRMVQLDDPPANHRSPYLDDDLADDTHIRNLDDVIPWWREPDTRFTMQGDPTDRRPWPTEPVQQLVWLADGPAEVWLPTSTQLAELHTQRRHRIDPPLDGEPGDLMSNTNSSQPWGHKRPATIYR